MNFKTKPETEQFEQQLIDNGYRKMNGHYKSEDYGFWKSFDITTDTHGDKEIGYQIVFLMYDFTKYQQVVQYPYQYTCELVIGDTNPPILRCDVALMVNNNCSDISRFESFYQKLYEYIKTNRNIFDTSTPVQSS